ncbi:MAG: sensor histidine kinase, partial [Sphingobacteriales bacterium]
DIHDELGQQLTVLKMDISWLNKKLTTNDPIIKQKTKELEEMADDTIKTVRRISSELRPSLLDNLGLVAALEWQSREFEKRTGIKTRFAAEAPFIKLPDKIATGLFRIFQESLTNVARHAQATSIHLSLKIENNKILMNINDNGKGFIPGNIKNNETLGILGMRERALILGGKYIIQSEPGEGTMVKVIIPIDNSDKA